MEILSFVVALVMVGVLAYVREQSDIDFILRDFGLDD